MLTIMKKLQFLKFWVFFGEFFKNSDYWKILNFDMAQYFRMKPNKKYLEFSWVFT